jgi:hypothetical protein
MNTYTPYNYTPPTLTAEEKKERRRELRKANFKAYFPKKSIVFWAIIAVWVLILILCNIDSPKVADFVHNNLFPLYTETIGRFAGETDSSPDGLILFVVLGGFFVIVANLIVYLIRLLKHEPAPKAEVVLFYISIVAIMMYFNFMLSSSFMYYTSPIEKKMGFEVYEYSDEEMQEYSDWLVEKVNTLSTEVPRDEEGKVVLSDDIIQKSLKAVQDVSDDIPQLKGYVDSNPEPFDDSLYNLAVGTMAETDFIFFQIEYTSEMYGLSLPVTIAHEAGHARGFGREDECNFIGYYAGINSDDPVLQYSAYMNMLLSVTGIQDEEEPFVTEDDLSANVLKDIEFDEEAFVAGTAEYIEREGMTEEDYEEMVEELVGDYNDMLVENGVEEGIQSYYYDLYLAVGLYLSMQNS